MPVILCYRFFILIFSGLLLQLSRPHTKEKKRSGYAKLIASYGLAVHHGLIIGCGYCSGSRSQISFPAKEREARLSGGFTLKESGAQRPRG